MKIRYGITGNYYIYSEDKSEIEEVLKIIGKSKSSIYFNSKHKVFCSRIKSKKHKHRIRDFLRYYKK